MPSGRDREKCCDGAQGAACGKPKTDDRGGAIGVPLLTLDVAEEGVCAKDNGCGWPLPKLPRDGCGRPMRLASNMLLRIGVWAGVVLWPTELSRDIRFLVFEAAAPGSANSPSNMGLGRGELVVRCESVDFLSEVVRRSGVSAGFIGGENAKALESLYIRGDSSGDVRAAGIGSKILSKSTPRLEAP
jgi:hypothetical protein